MIRSPAGFDGEDRIKRYLDYYQPSYGVMMLSAGQFSPLQLFASGEQGVWYDPSDLSTMFQDSAGTTPVTAVEQPVGLLLDKSKGLVLGSELVPNPGNPFVSTTGYSAGGLATISIDAGRLRVSQTVGFTDGVLCALPNNAFSTSTVISFTVDLGSSTLVQVQAGNGNFGNGGVITVNITASGTYNITTTTLSSGASGLTFKAGSASNFFLSSVSVKQRPGNHAFQSTPASRPVLSARVNLLTHTEEFNNAAWAKSNSSITATNGIAPNGTATADTLTENTATSGHGLTQGFVTAASTAYTFAVYAKANGRSSIDLVTATGFTTNPVVRFTLSGSGASATRQGNPSPTHSIQSVGSGWYLCRINVTTVAGGSTTFGVNLVSDDAGSSFYTGDGTSGILIWGADLRLTNQTTNLPAYQRVVTATDYDTTGFPMYLKFDGNDDSMATGTINPGSVDKAQVFAGVRKLSDAAQGVLAEWSATIASNNGTFLLAAPDGATATFGFDSKGTTQVDAVASGQTAPLTAVLSGLAHISGDIATIRVNGAQADQDTGDQGTGNYLSYPLYIGRRGGTSLPFNGHLYSLIVRFGANLPDATIAQTETWVNGKTGAY